MRILPILFNADMVRALLEGRKTVTRRVIKPQPANPRWNIIGWAGWDDGHGRRMNVPYQPGDILYVREAWYKSDFGYEYRATYNDLELKGWKPSIHMPKEAARIFLRVKDVRVERLQDITAEKVLDEGVDVKFPEPHPGYISLAYTKMRLEPAAIKQFSELWDSTIKPADRDEYGWDANPWVWVIEFERVERPEGWLGVKKNGA